MPDEGKVLVEHVVMVKKNVRPNPQQNIKGGIAEQESPISLSNVTLVCKSCNRPVRLGHEIAAIERSGHASVAATRWRNSH